MNGQRFHPGMAHAFSLIELTIVVAILAVTLAIATPRYQHALANYRVDATAQRVVTDLHAARRAAEQTGRAHTVTFDLDAHTITYHAPSLDRQREVTQVTRLTASPYEARLRSVDFDGERAIRFDGFGTPEHSGTVVVEAGGRQRTISLDASSGRARVQ